MKGRPAGDVISADPLTCSNNHIQDVLLVSYLANTIRKQIDLSNRLATATINMDGEDTSKPDAQQRGGAGTRGGVHTSSSRSRYGQ